MKTAATILTVLLTVLVHFTSSQHHDREFNHFLYRLEKAVNATCVGFLPFTLPVGVIQNLRWTSDEFKNLCLEYDEKNEILSPITALEKTIYNIFNRYKRSAERKILEEIETVDPIGLNVYLTKKNVKNSSPMFMDFVTIFMETMKERIGLFSMKTDDSYFLISDRNDYEHLQRIPHSIRDELAAEYGNISDDPINMFTDLVTEVTSNRMYRIGTEYLDVYQKHNSSTMDDVQIIYGTYRDNETYWTKVHASLHAICICYKASTEMVHVYDSLMNDWVDDREEAIIQKLYPYNKGIYFERSLSIQDKNPTCAIFAMTYATMLILGQDPNTHHIKLNKVHGDETLYMRMHILNMLATRKLSLLK